MSSIGTFHQMKKVWEYHTMDMWFHVNIVIVVAIDVACPRGTKSEHQNLASILDFRIGLNPNSTLVTPFPLIFTYCPTHTFLGDRILYP